MTYFRPRKFKYGETRTQALVGGKTRNLNSKLEAAVLQILQLQERSGIITDIKTQVRVTFTNSAGKHKACIPDFRVTNCATSEVYFVEAKGFVNERWEWIRWVWADYGPGRLVVYGGDWKRPMITETIEPVKRERGKAS